MIRPWSSATPTSWKKGACHHSTSHTPRMTNAFCLPRTIKFPIHRTLSAKTELGQTKAVGLFLLLPKGKLVETQRWMDKGARQKKYIAVYHCASQDWIALVYWQTELISNHSCSPGFPGGPAVKTLSFHRRGCRFSPWLGTACPESQPKQRRWGGLVIPVAFFSQDTCQKTFSVTGKAYWWFLVNCQYLKSNINEPEFSNNP